MSGESATFTDVIDQGWLGLSSGHHPSCISQKKPKPISIVFCSCPSRGTCFWKIWFTSILLQNYGHGCGGKKVGGTEIIAWKHTVQIDNIQTYKHIDSKWEFTLWLGELKPGLCDSLEGWDGEGGGRELHGRGHRFSKPMADSCWCLVETNAIL